MDRGAHWFERAGFWPAVVVLCCVVPYLAWRGLREPVYLDRRGQVVGEVVLEVDLRLNVNRASAGQMQSIPQIGPALAGRIVADREANGPFASVEELQRVAGMGQRTVERIREFVVCGE